MDRQTDRRAGAMLSAAPSESRIISGWMDENAEHTTITSVRNTVAHNMKLNTQKLISQHYQPYN